MTLDPNGRECHCGNRGCWETQVGAVAIAEAVDCPPEQVASLGEFLAGVEHANDALRGVARDLGRGLANLVNVVNPRVIVLGGYLRSLYPLVAHDVQAALADVALVAPHEQVRLALPALEGDSVLVGAAETAFAALLADPVESLHTAQCDIDAAVSALL